MKASALLVSVLMISPLVVLANAHDDGASSRPIDVPAIEASPGVSCGPEGPSACGPSRVPGPVASGTADGGASADTSDQTYLGETSRPTLPPLRPRATAAANGVPNTGEGRHTLRAEAGGVPPSPVPPLHLRTAIAPDGIHYAGPGPYIVQFPGDGEGERAVMEAQGAVFHDRIPVHGWIVDLERKPAEDGIARLFPLAPGMKVLSEGTTYMVTVTDTDAAAEGLRSLGIDTRRAGGRLLAEIPPGSVQTVAFLPTVLYLEAWSPGRAMVDIASSIIDPAGMAADLGLNGSGQVVAVVDTGLDTGVINSSMHPDLRGQVVAVVDWTGDGPDDDDSHGTHVTGTIVGTGAASNGTFTGIAPGAKVIVQAVADDSGAFSGASDLYAVLQQAYNASARISSNSWGYYDSSYNGASQDVDDFVDRHDDMLVVIAAGNYGTDGDADGEVDNASIIAPANAKNGIAVGASESLRSSGGYSNDTYGERWPSDFPAAPINGDLISDDPQGMAAFSSRGNCPDGRLKPDIVAPGTDIVSVRSQVGASTLWGVYDDSYLYSGGTSMATPVVSAAAAIVRQHAGLLGWDPNAALVKAILIITADDMAGQYQYSGASAPIPNIHEGWGRLNLTRALDVGSGLLSAMDRGPALSTGEYVEYTVPCVSDSEELRFALVWTDAPGSPLASIQLVNDLDLTVIAPNGTLYKGNVFADGVSVPGDGNSDPEWDTDGNGYDDRNNVECVYVGPPTTGVYRVRVSARDASEQDFALAIHGKVGPDYSPVGMVLDGEPRVGSPVNVTVDVRDQGWRSNLTGGLVLEPMAALDFVPADLALSPNATVAIAVGAGGDAALLSAQGVRYLHGISGDLRAAAFRPDGGYALIAGEDGLFRWSASSHIQRVFAGDLRDVAFHPNGTAVAVGDGAIVHYPGPATLVLDDPCDSSSGWTTGGTGNVWERGTPDASQAFPGNHSPAAVWGTDLDADHPANMDAWLRRNVDLTGHGNPTLTFWHYRDFEDGYDGGVVEVLGASQWEALVPEGGYDGHVDALGRSGFHSFTAWKKETVYLDAYAGEMVTIRFRFASDEFIQNAGWFIDDVRVVDRSAHERSTASELTRVACNATGALAGGSELLLAIPAMTAKKPSGLEPAGIWWSDGWSVVDVNGSIFSYDGSLVKVAAVGAVRSVDAVSGAWDRAEGGWIAAEDGIHRFAGTLETVYEGAVDVIAAGVGPYFLASIGNATYILGWATADPVVRLLADGVPVVRTAGTGNVTFEWTPGDFGVVRLTAEVNPDGPDRIPEGRYDNNTFAMDVVVRPDGRFVLVVDDDGGGDAEASVVDVIGACHVHDQSEAPVDDGTMAEFDAVVWVVGDEIAETLNATERAEIGAYLDAGGRLFTFGQGIARGAVSDEWTDWMAAYLGAAIVSHGTDNDRVIGTDLYEGMDTDIGDDRPSALSPVGTARTAFEYPDGNASAVLFTGGHRAAYWGFGLHRMVDQDVMAAALNRTLDFLLDGTPPEMVADLSPDNATTGDIYSIRIEADDDVGVSTVVTWHDDGTGWTSTPLSRDGGSWWGNITVWNGSTLLGLVHTITDFSGNQNSTAQRDVQVTDDDPPTASLGAVGLRTGENGTVEVLASDNVGLADVRLVYRFLPIDEGGNVSANETVALTVHVNASVLNATAYVVDGAGNFAVVPLGDVPVEDVLPPEREIVLTGATYEPGTDLVLRARFEDNIGVVGGTVHVEYAEVSLDAPLAPDGDSFIALIDIGNHTGVVNYTFTPEDAWGNSAEMAPHKVYPKDTMPPEVHIEVVQPPVNGQNMTVNITVVDAVAVNVVTVSVAMDGGEPFIVEPSGALPDLILDIGIPLNASAVVISVNASDHSGNWNLTTLPEMEVADPLPPALAVAHDDPRSGSTFGLTYDASDHRGLASLWASYSFDGGELTNVSLLVGGAGSLRENGTLMIAVPADAERIAMNVTAIDGSGNGAWWEDDVRVKDTVRPVITVNSGRKYSDGHYRLEFDVHDAGDLRRGYVVYVHGGGYFNRSFDGTGINVIEIFDVRGTLNITITAVDIDGNAEVLSFDVREAGGGDGAMGLEGMLILVAAALAALFVVGLLVTTGRTRRARGPAPFECPLCGGGVRPTDGECPTCGTPLDWAGEDERP